jgi:uncharacterized repeat protein (TIGR03803 family)
MKRLVVFVLFAMGAIALPAQTLTVLHSFDYTDGANPFAGVVLATNGKFYGTTYGGGANGNVGTVFEMTPGGTLTSLHSFCTQSNCTDGQLPVGGLIQGADGNLYGTSGLGGANNRGEVFQMTQSGTLTTVYSFCAMAGCTDGSQPYPGLIHATDGNFYGTTKFGGANGVGTIFKMTPGGGLTTLYNFCPTSGCADGEEPDSGLVQASDGNFYGTTLYGGANNSGNSGTVFKMTAGGGLTTLYSFCAKTNCADGSQPYAALIQVDGEFYGTTAAGGAHSNNGTVFKITASGTLTTLYSFCSQPGCVDGQTPTGALVQATDGNLYGTTDSGGNGYGTIFRITGGGELTTVYSFPNPGKGQEPYAALIQAPNGEFYGTTFIGGAHGYGEVFSLDVGLGPFIETEPTSGKAGSAVKILGTDLTGASSVKFHGVAAVFQVVSKTEITTNVPAGGTTGEVKVVTPGGTLSSNVEFRVP